MISLSNLLAVIVCCLVSTFSQSSGKLVVLHHPQSKHVTCVSENDGSALVWNYNFKSRSFNIPEFKPRRPNSGNIWDCAIWRKSTCLTEWDETSDWHVVNSATKPTGPVYDYRWEDFQGLGTKSSYYEQSRDKIIKVKRSSSTVWLSARAAINGSVGILLCEREERHLSPCIWIRLGYNGESIIRSCDRGPTNRHKQLDVEAQCLTKISCHQNGDTDILDPYQWRTFRVEWNVEKDTIKVFKATASEPFMAGRMPWGDISYVSIADYRSARLKFHFHDYFLTETTNAVISTGGFVHSSKMFRAQLLVGLCPTCKLNVTLVDGNGHNVETWSFHGDEQDPYRGLLTWQVGRLTTRLDNDNPRLLKLKVKTISGTDEGSGEWAIDNFRIHASGEMLRESTSTMRTNVDVAACQRLSYVENTVVKSVSPKNTDDAKILSELQEFIRPQYGRVVGRSGFICDSNGCICDRGYKGSDCLDECSDGFYGYNCKKTCGSCHNSGHCAKSTGFCEAGCQGNRIAPFCKTAIVALTVKKVRDTTATVLQSAEFDEDEVANLTVQIREKDGGESWLMDFPLDPSDSRRLHAYEAHMTGLKPSTAYTLRTVVSVKTTEKTTLTFGPKYTFVTNRLACSKIRNLRVKSVSDTSVTVQWDPPKDVNEIIRNYSVSLKLTQLRGCKDLNRITPHEEDIVLIAKETTVSFDHLHPYANYVVTVQFAESSKPGLSTTLSFETSSSRIPTSMVSNLRINEDERRVEWDKPEDCTRITGPMEVTRLFITRVRDSVLIKSSQTSLPYFNLSDVHLESSTWYRMRVHVVRGYDDGPENPDVYRELTWRTDLADLEAPSVVDVTDSTAKIIQKVESAADDGKILVFFILTQVRSNDTATLHSTNATTLKYELDLKNLEPNTFYKVHTLVTSMGSERPVALASPPLLFKTKCIADLPQFDVSPGEGNLTIHMTSRPKDCEDSPSQLYSIKVYDVAKDSVTTSAAISSFPFIIMDLKPSTEYGVKIWMRLPEERQSVFTTKIRTFGSVGIYSSLAN